MESSLKFSSKYFPQTSIEWRDERETLASLKKPSARAGTDSVFAFRPEIVVTNFETMQTLKTPSILREQLPQCIQFDPIKDEQIKNFITLDKSKKSIELPFDKRLFMSSMGISHQQRTESSVYAPMNLTSINSGLFSSTEFDQPLLFKRTTSGTCQTEPVGLSFVKRTLSMHQAFPSTFIPKPQLSQESQQKLIHENNRQSEKIRELTWKLERMRQEPNVKRVLYVEENYSTATKVIDLEQENKRLREKVTNLLFELKLAQRHKIIPQKQGSLTCQDENLKLMNILTELQANNEELQKRIINLTSVQVENSNLKKENLQLREYNTQNNQTKGCLWW